MSQGTATIDKIKLIDGTIVDLLTNQSIEIPDLAEYNVYPEYDSFSGKVELISGTTDEYLLTLPTTG
ncbi:MAG: hypothetical protein IK088_01275, partial [Lachnospiraceae bacterium]|nr:hypothetical protein [Lachnospiraceae bacterium]